MFKLLPGTGDVAAGDRFGNAVAIDGAYAVIGADFDDNETGSIYIFDVATGQQLFKRSPADVEVGDRFGAGVAISGNLIVCGSIFDIDDDNGIRSGSAYVYDASTGQELMKLRPNDGAVAANDRFGNRVAIDGNIAVIGAWQADDNGADSGAAYLFDVSTGQQLHKLLPDDGAMNDLFGLRVAIDGDVVVVSATNHQDNGTGSGAAYLFDAATGQQIYKLLPDDGEAEDRFGQSVDVDGRIVIIGAGWSDDFGDLTGSAYVFDALTGRQSQKLLPGDAAEGDQFGLAAAVNGNRAVIGAGFDDDNGMDSGSAYLFEVAICASDLNGDSAVDTADLGILLGFFGQSNPILPQADINGDGVVDTADLGILLGSFGENCP